MKKKQRRLLVVLLAVWACIVIYFLPLSGETLKSWNFLTTMHGLLTAGTVPIEFYGQVLDQDDSPVAGASVKAEVAYYAGFSLTRLRELDLYDAKEVELTTDAEGRFKLDDLKGRSVRFWVSKEGYIGADGPVGYFYDPSEGSAVHHPDPARPEVFPLWKKGAGVELLSFDVRLFIENTDPNRIYTVSLLEDRIMPGVSGEGDMVVEAYNEGGGLNELTGRRLRKEYDWEVKLLLPGDGGILKTDDPYPYRAPEAGYQAQLVFRSNKADKDWTSIKRGNYYFRDSQGRYGRLHLEVKARAYEIIVRFEEVAVNPDGSRNLQPMDDEDEASPEELEVLMLKVDQLEQRQRQVEKEAKCRQRYAVSVLQSLCSIW